MSKIKILLFLIFELLFQIVNSQTFNEKIEIIGTNHFEVESFAYTSNQHSLHGKIKTVRIKEYLIFDNKHKYKNKISLKINDSLIDLYINEDNYLEFNTDGFLTLEGRYFQNKLNISTSYGFNNSNKIISDDNYINNKVFSTTNYKYESNNLIEVWKKNIHQKDFKLKYKFEYDKNNNLIKKFDINNFIEFSGIHVCMAGSNYEDFITYYKYKKNKQLKKIINKQFEYKTPDKTVPNEKEFSFYNKTKLCYQNNHLESEKFSGNTSIGEAKIETKYQYDNKILAITTKSNFGENYFYAKVYINYFYENNSDYKIEKKYSSDNTIENYYYKNNILRRFEKTISDKIDCVYEYDSNENLVLKNENGSTINYKIEYDSNNNWIKYISLNNGKISGYIVREIEYYD